jgi:hypothetical protein
MVWMQQAERSPRVINLLSDKYFIRLELESPQRESIENSSHWPGYFDTSYASSSQLSDSIKLTPFQLFQLRKERRIEQSAEVV